MGVRSLDFRADRPILATVPEPGEPTGVSVLLIASQSLKASLDPDDLVREMNCTARIFSSPASLTPLLQGFRISGAVLPDFNPAAGLFDGKPGRW